MGAAWHGTTTRHPDIHLQLFRRSKSAEIFLINEGVRYDVDETHDVAATPYRCSILQPYLGYREDARVRPVWMICEANTASTPKGHAARLAGNVDLLLKEDDK